MSQVKTIKVLTGHVMAICPLERHELPEEVAKSVATVSCQAEYKTFYAIRNFDVGGYTVMYLCLGAHGPRGREVHAFYPNGQMWSSYGKNIESTISGAIRDGWLYTK